MADIQDQRRKDPFDARVISQIDKRRTTSQVQTAHIADNSITTAKIAAGTVIASDVATGAISTAKIADDAVTEAKLANSLLAEIDANTAKNTNVATNLSISGTTGARTIASSDGTDAVIPIATTSVSGVMSKAIFDQHTANVAKNTNVVTNLSITGSAAARTIVSSDGTDAVIPLGTTSVSGLLSPALFDEIDANTAKTTNATHSGEVTGATTLTIANNAVTLAKMAGGTDGNLISYDTSGDPVAVATGNDGQVLTSAGAGAVPTFETLPVIAAEEVTLAMLAHAAANTVLVRDANSPGDPSFKAVTNTQVLIGDGTGFTAAALSGDATMTNAGVVSIGANKVITTKILNSNVTTDKIADNAVTAGKLAGVLGPSITEIFVPARDMTPTITAGCSALTNLETTAGRPDIQSLDFDKDATEFAQFSLALPKRVAGGALEFSIYWSTATADTNTVAWTLQAQSFGNDDSIDTAFGSSGPTAAVTVTDAVTTVEDLHIAVAGAPIEVLNFADGDLTYFRIGRDHDFSQGGTDDDHGGDAKLIGVKLLVTHDQHNDQ